MTTVTITRAFSGFVNVEDTMLVGNHDDLAGTVADYVLPEGYWIADDRMTPRIVDPNGYECFICPLRNGAMLMSLAGSARDIVLAKA